LSVDGSNETARKGPAEFNGLNQVRGDANYSVYPLERGAIACSLVVDLVANLEVVRESCWVPGDVGYDGVPTSSVDDVGVHLECRETLPFPVLLVPQIFNFGAAGLGDGSSFAECTHP
jgi:hypothetical protein